MQKYDQYIIDKVGLLLNTFQMILRILNFIF